MILTMLNHCGAKAEILSKFIGSPPFMVTGDFGRQAGSSVISAHSENGMMHSAGRKTNDARFTVA
ncbi:hypothetical protein [Chelativorans alearense]|uniref:hypothetical protein n=1 Tax=Chelativorans alearense TaxID=2681495 RepID=UPI0013D6BF43|nr:hypothetical protein [Chelativorans alearense]